MCMSFYYYCSQIFIKNKLNGECEIYFLIFNSEINSSIVMALLYHLTACWGRSRSDLL